ncbi:protein of unknown function [Methylocaldum szegediense]|uniref:Uncharacterized protein n=1 Tax=Methylocaldum szegediense TaxID=73780 RepID=A0ABM9I4F1_9GAMM|nr:protein of unknown function [Methylocaldum szegediense]
MLLVVGMNFSRYSSYKYSDVEWLEEVPEHFSTPH